MLPQNSIRSIRNRLFLLLLRAFLFVVAFLVLFNLAATAIVLTYPSRTNPLYRLPSIARLETFYIARGSWQGVNAIFTNSLDIESSQWQASILLDANDRVVVDHGTPVDPGIAQVYHPASGESVASIVVNGQVVGKLVVSQDRQPPERIFTYRFLQPVLLLSIGMAIFATLIGLLLTRRVVTPLAEVISAAEQIAGGRLETRVKARGSDDLRDLSNSFNKMADSLERNDRERREMLADIAHELRTPLTVMRGRLEGILDGIYPADASHVGPVLEEAYLLERLVEDLRLLTLVESKQLAFERRPVDLTEIARRSISMFQAEADEKKIHLELISSLGTVSVLADPLRIEQVIGNLLSNALRYVPEGKRVWIEITAQGREGIISINDDGQGVPEADLPFLFNRFWRGESSRSRITGGAGLGLAIARSLVEGQGGTILASNLPGAGLRVCVTLPAADEQD